MNKSSLLHFLLLARTKTYAGDGGTVKPAFPGATQLEYRDGEWLYRDFYNMGNGIFMGLETVHEKGKPVWSNSYFGNFQGMTEQEIDTILKAALIAKKDKTRLWYNVEWKKDGYRYVCTSDGRGKGLDEIGGQEEIYKGNKRVYYFFYAGGVIG